MLDSWKRVIMNFFVFIIKSKIRKSLLDKGCAILVIEKCRLKLKQIE